MSIDRKLYEGVVDALEACPPFPHLNDLEKKFLESTNVPKYKLPKDFKAFARQLSAMGLFQLNSRDYVTDWMEPGLLRALARGEAPSGVTDSFLTVMASLRKSGAAPPYDVKDVERLVLGARRCGPASLREDSGGLAFEDVCRRLALDGLVTLGSGIVSLGSGSTSLLQVIDVDWAATESYAAADLQELEDRALAVGDTEQQEAGQGGGGAPPQRGGDEATEVGAVAAAVGMMSPAAAVLSGGRGRMPPHLGAAGGSHGGGATAAAAGAGGDDDSKPPTAQQQQPPKEPPPKQQRPKEQQQQRPKEQQQQQQRPKEQQQQQQRPKEQQQPEEQARQQQDRKRGEGERRSEAAATAAGEPPQAPSKAEQPAGGRSSRGRDHNHPQRGTSTEPEPSLVSRSSLQRQQQQDAGKPHGGDKALLTNRDDRPPSAAAGDGERGSKQSGRREATAAAAGTATAAAPSAGAPAAATARRKGGSRSRSRERTVDHRREQRRTSRERERCASPERKPRRGSRSRSRDRRRSSRSRDARRRAVSRSRERSRERRPRSRSRDRDRDRRRAASRSRDRRDRRSERLPAPAGGSTKDGPRGETPAPAAPTKLPAAPTAAQGQGPDAKASAVPRKAADGGEGTSGAPAPRETPVPTTPSDGTPKQQTLQQQQQQLADARGGAPPQARPPAASSKRGREEEEHEENENRRRGRGGSTERGRGPQESDRKGGNTQAARPSTSRDSREREEPPPRRKGGATRQAIVRLPSALHHLFRKVLLAVWEAKGRSTFKCSALGEALQRQHRNWSTDFSDPQQKRPLRVSDVVVKYAEAGLLRTYPDHDLCITDLDVPLIQASQAFDDVLRRGGDSGAGDSVGGRTAGGRDSKRESQERSVRARRRSRSRSSERGNEGGGRSAKRPRPDGFSRQCHVPEPVNSAYLRVMSSLWAQSNGSGFSISTVAQRLIDQEGKQWRADLGAGEYGELQRAVIPEYTRLGLLHTSKQGGDLRVHHFSLDLARRLMSSGNTADAAPAAPASADNPLALAPPYSRQGSRGPPLSREESTATAAATAAGAHTPATAAGQRIGAQGGGGGQDQGQQGGLNLGLGSPRLPAGGPSARVLRAVLLAAVDAWTMRSGVCKFVDLRGVDGVVQSLDPHLTREDTLWGLEWLHAKTQFLEMQSNHRRFPNPRVMALRLDHARSYLTHQLAGNNPACGPSSDGVGGSSGVGGVAGGYDTKDPPPPRGVAWLIALSLLEAWRLKRSHFTDVMAVGEVAARIDRGWKDRAGPGWASVQRVLQWLQQEHSSCLKMQTNVKFPNPRIFSVSAERVCTYILRSGAASDAAAAAAANGGGDSGGSGRQHQQQQQQGVMAAGRGDPREGKDAPPPGLQRALVNALLFCWENRVGTYVDLRSVERRLDKTHQGWRQDVAQRADGLRVAVDWLQHHAPGGEAHGSRSLVRLQPGHCRFPNPRIFEVNPARANDLLLTLPLADKKAVKQAAAAAAAAQDAGEAAGSSAAARPDARPPARLHALFVDGLEALSVEAAAAAAAAAGQQQQGGGGGSGEGVSGGGDGAGGAAGGGGGSAPVQLHRLSKWLTHQWASWQDAPESEGWTHLQRLADIYVQHGVLQPGPTAGTVVLTDVSKLRPTHLAISSGKLPCATTTTIGGGSSTQGPSPGATVPAAVKAEGGGQVAGQVDAFLEDVLGSGGSGGVDHAAAADDGRVPPRATPTSPPPTALVQPKAKSEPKAEPEPTAEPEPMVADDVLPAVPQETEMLPAVRQEVTMLPAVPQEVTMLPALMPVEQQQQPEQVPVEQMVAVQQALPAALEQRRPEQAEGEATLPLHPAQAPGADDVPERQQQGQARAEVEQGGGGGVDAAAAAAAAAALSPHPSEAAAPLSTKSTKSLDSSHPPSLLATNADVEMCEVAIAEPRAGQQPPAAQQQQHEDGGLKEKNDGGQQLADATTLQPGAVAGGQKAAAGGQLQEEQQAGSAAIGTAVAAAVDDASPPSPALFGVVGAEGMPAAQQEMQQQQQAVEQPSSAALVESGGGNRIEVVPCDTDGFGYDTEDDYISI